MSASGRKLTGQFHEQQRIELPFGGDTPIGVADKADTLRGFLRCRFRALCWSPLRCGT